MQDCCEQDQGSVLETLPAGLATLPRQLRSFSDVRRELLAALPGKVALRAWKPSGDDLGLMWLEMWAYVADVLSFYDARVADASYLRTAVSRRALRRIVELIGYSPGSGIAGRVAVAALGNGKASVLPAGTKFRSAAFGSESPQVFETREAAAIDPLKNLWTVAPFKRAPRVDPQPSSSSAPPVVPSLLFEPGGYGLAVDALVAFESVSPEFPNAVTPQVTRVASSAPFAGKDGAAYVRASFDPPVAIEPELNLDELRVRTPVQSFVATTHTPKTSAKSTTAAIAQSGGSTVVYSDGLPGRFRVNDVVIVAKNLQGSEAQLVWGRVTAVEAAALEVSALPPPEGGTRLVVVGTRLSLSPDFSATLGVDGSTLSFHHEFVDAGRPTNVARTTVSTAELSDSVGVPLGDGIRPPANLQTLEQRFLVGDARGQAADVAGRITFGSDGSARFQLVRTSDLDIDTWSLPLRVYGNVVDTTRGESVAREVLGDGDARQVNQAFKLKKSPLTYLAPGESTLKVWVNGLRWQEVPNLFGSGPEDYVYYVRQNDAAESTVLFGDGVYGARLPTGVGNVVASYRHGAGFASPPSDAINQLASAVEGLQGVASPLKAQPGKDPDDPNDLREMAPRSALMLGRIVGLPDFEAAASRAPGVVRAVARFGWIEGQAQAGVRVDYIGDADEASMAQMLRSQCDPTQPLAVVRARPIRATLSMAVEVDSRAEKGAVVRAVAAYFTAKDGVLSPARAQIGGHFWPSALHAAALRVAGVLGISGLRFSTESSELAISATQGACLPDDAYLDFTASDALSVTGVESGS